MLILSSLSYLRSIDKFPKHLQLQLWKWANPWSLNIMWCLDSVTVTSYCTMLDSEDKITRIIWFYYDKITRIIWLTMTRFQLKSLEIELTGLIDKLKINMFGTCSWCHVALQLQNLFPRCLSSMFLIESSLNLVKWKTNKSGCRTRNWVQWKKLLL